MKPLRILVACEFSGIVRDAFIARGHDAWSCDLRLSNSGSNHICGDVLKVIDNDWDMMIAHPPCTFLTCTGNKWNHARFNRRVETRLANREKAVAFFMAIAECRISKYAIENPVGIMSTRFRKPDQVIQPFEFGDPTRKATCLWLRNLSPLISTNVVAPKIVRFKSGKTMSESYSPKGMPTRLRASHRSKTFKGIANAMADQWG